jgi:sodium-dependent dicarboxylate transporter 2/3/5
MDILKAFITDGFKKIFYTPFGRKAVSTVIAIIFSVPFFFIKLSSEYPYASPTLGCALAMSILWMTNAIPLGVTALFPVIMFPVLGISSGSNVAMQYINNISMIFIGGFIVALGIYYRNDGL